MINKMAENRIKAGGQNLPNVLVVRLLWWPISPTTGNVVWSDKVPHCREVKFEVSGTWSKRRRTFSAHAVQPLEEIPAMNNGAQKQLVRALKDAVDSEYDFPIEGITNRIVAWEYEGNVDI